MPRALQRAHSIDFRQSPSNAAPIPAKPLAPHGSSSHESPGTSHDSCRVVRKSKTRQEITETAKASPLQIDSSSGFTVSLFRQKFPLRALRLSAS